MISPFAFRQFVPDVLYNPPVRKLMPREGLKDEEYAICTPVLLGFSFERKLWGTFRGRIIFLLFHIYCAGGSRCRV